MRIVKPALDPTTLVCRVPLPMHPFAKTNYKVKYVGLLFDKAQLKSVLYTAVFNRLP